MPHNDLTRNAVLRRMKVPEKRPMVPAAKTEGNRSPSPSPAAVHLRMGHRPMGKR